MNQQINVVPNTSGVKAAVYYEDEFGAPGLCEISILAWRIETEQPIGGGDAFSIAHPILSVPEHEEDDFLYIDNGMYVFPGDCEIFSRDEAIKLAGEKYSKALEHYKKREKAR